MKRVLIPLFVCLMCFCTFGATASKAAFSQADFEGSWDFIYTYSIAPGIPLMGLISFDANGDLTSGVLTTDGDTLTSGNLSFTDPNTGALAGTITSPNNINSMSGVMDGTKTLVWGTWSNVTSDGSFWLEKRPAAGTKPFSVSDLSGVWNISYKYTGDATTYLGEVAFDSQGIMTSGVFTTAGYTIDSGGATFYDFDLGGVDCSLLYYDGGNPVVVYISGVMNAGKDTIDANWADWYGFGGTLTAQKQQPVQPVSTGDGGGGGGCFIGTTAPFLK